MGYMPSKIAAADYSSPDRATPGSSRRHSVAENMDRNEASSSAMLSVAMKSNLMNEYGCQISDAISIRHMQIPTAD